jgi:hypothetical protein
VILALGLHVNLGTRAAVGYTEWSLDRRRFGGAAGAALARA